MTDSFEQCCEQMLENLDLMEEMVRALDQMDEDTERLAPAGTPARLPGMAATKAPASSYPSSNARIPYPGPF